MASFLGTVRPSPSSVSCFAPCRRQISVYTSQISLPTSGFFPFKRILQACLQSSFSTIALFVGFLPMGTCLIITSCISARIRTIDAVIITHSHADAIGGLDDLRDWTNNVQRHIPIYVAMRDFEVMKKTHYYLVDTSGIIPGAAVSELQFNIIDEEPFTVQDLKITPLPVWHGAGYRSLGFRFGNICYISDVSEIPEETYPFLQDCEILIMDALRPDRSSSTHFGLPRALEEVRKIQPKRTLFIGMMHLMDHEKVNEELLKLMETEGLDVQLSYDGLRVPVML
ncbi:putative hydrolase C777.06c isoform X3 [Citrus clementina]|uniref:putative hydrolase C777.06c isoform X3 n=1 Tax=Citrus clementina TaxID=85681 RepID=UPI000CED772F|nr:putative hydrolase C777.06c isoform X3 [Citrus x clementina]